MNKTNVALVVSVAALLTTSGVLVSDHIETNHAPVIEFAYVEPGFDLCVVESRPHTIYAGAYDIDNDLLSVTFWIWGHEDMWIQIGGSIGNTGTYSCNVTSDFFTMYMVNISDGQYMTSQIYRVSYIC